VCDCGRHAIVCLGVVGTVDALLDFWNFFLFGFAQQQLVRNLRVDVFRAIIRQLRGRRLRGCSRSSGCSSEL
jgi:hypothetical protein